MRILVLPKNLEVGGTQVNAVDTALGLRRRGHEVTVASAPGPLASRLADGDVDWVLLPTPDARTKRLRALNGLIRELSPDVVHAYEVRGIMDCALSGLSAGRPPLLGSILSTRVPWFLPENVPLTVGMPNLASFTNRWRSGRTTLIEPPVPTFEGAEPLSPVADLDDGEVLVVLVSRLVEPFKREGILRTISAMHTLGGEGFRLAIVGEGPARPIYERAAIATNQALDARVIAFIGLLVDAGPAFAAADVVVGSGTSVMRGVIGGRPAVVVGRDGFSVLVTPAALPQLVDEGFYGVGDGIRSPDPLVTQLRDAAAGATTADLRMMAAELSAHYGPDAVVRRFEEELAQAAEGPGPSLPVVARALGRAVHYRLRRRRLAGEAARLGLVDEHAANHVYGTLRNMALPPSRRLTGRNRG